MSFKENLCLRKLFKNFCAADHEKNATALNATNLNYLLAQFSCLENEINLFFCI